MGKDKILSQLLSGASDNNIGLAICVSYCAALDLRNAFAVGHHIYSKHGVEELINLQRDGNKAKSYQVKQVRAVIVKYKLAGDY